MNKVGVKDILLATQGDLHMGSVDLCVEKVTTDTRSEIEGSLFFALKGENFDANDFLQKAVDGKAAVIVAERLPEGFDGKDSSVILVNNSLLALQRLAAWYRQQLDIEVVGITGSNGKTSTKDFTKAVVGYKHRVIATKGNLNNHIGVPLSVFEANSMHEVAIWEMGMNHPGEIAPLCQISKPKIGVITNIGTAHIEFMGSRDAIAEEKGTLAKFLPQDGTLVVPAICEYNQYLMDRTKARTIIVGNGRGAVRAEDLVTTLEGTTFTLIIDGDQPAKVSIPVMGKHMVTNAMLAAAVGKTIGMTANEIASGLNQVELTSGRLRKYECRGVNVIDDTYNANPESVRAAVETLSEMELNKGAQRIIVLGAMGELGDTVDAAYRNIGKYAAEVNTFVISVGEDTQKIQESAEAAGGQAKHFNKREEAASFLKETCSDGDAVLFKGSRTAGMEKVMNLVF